MVKRAHSAAYYLVEARRMLSEKLGETRRAWVLSEGRVASRKELHILWI